MPFAGRAPLAELVDAPDSKSGSSRSAGSIPAGGTIDHLGSLTDQGFRWHDNQPVEVREAIIDNFVETGILDHEAAGMEEIEAQVIEASFVNHTERNVLKPLGLTLNQWNSYLSERDAATLRRAVVKGDWSALHVHAQKVASYIHQNGDVNKGNY